MTAFSTLLLTTALLVLGTLSTSSLLATAAPLGTPHSTVIPLTTKTFDSTVTTDSANTLWLLKFYAPWCGHCVALSPILDQAASHLAGKLSIGKIDCTVEKKICKGKFDVRGYPTLKYYRDGEFSDYPLGRDLDSIVSFGEKMSQSAVKVVEDVGRVYEMLVGGANGAVAYVVYDPKEQIEDEEDDSGIDKSGATEEEKEATKLLQSTERTRVFGQVARKYQAQGSFGLLSPSIDKASIAKVLGVGETNKIPDAGFIARIEEDVPTKFLTGDVINTEAFAEFIKETNIAVMTELGGHNFRFASRR
eukprot:scaffold6371_cov86-Skeletonema_dohrnii-CCMP3373.AAC.1